MVSLYEAISRPGFAIPESKAGRSMTAQSRPAKRGKTALNAMEWDVQQELISFRAKHEQQLKSIDVSSDRYTEIEPQQQSPITSEAEGYTLLSNTHFRCCNDVLRVIKPGSVIAFRVRKFLAQNISMANVPLCEIYVAQCS